MHEPDETDPDATSLYQTQAARNARPKPLRPLPPPPPLSRNLRIALALIAVNLLLLGAIGAWWAWPRAKPGAKDPYPECAAIREYLSRSTADPARCEVIEWGERELHYETKPPWMSLYARCREVNEHGAPVVWIREFIFKGGTLQGCRITPGAN